MLDEEKLALLKEFEEVWKLHPNWRFGQLIVNTHFADSPVSTLFNRSDSSLSDCLKELKRTT